MQAKMLHECNVAYARAVRIVQVFSVFVCRSSRSFSALFARFNAAVFTAMGFSVARILDNYFWFSTLVLSLVGWFVALGGLAASQSQLNAVTTNANVINIMYGLSLGWWLIWLEFFLLIAFTVRLLGIEYSDIIADGAHVRTGDAAGTLGTRKLPLGFCWILCLDVGVRGKFLFAFI
jgi:hypothetical protein